MTIQTITIIRKHVDRFASVDGCSDPRHGLSFGQCRIHRMERYKGKHRADMETLEGFPRMSSL